MRIFLYAIPAYYKTEQASRLSSNYKKCSAMRRHAIEQCWKMEGIFVKINIYYGGRGLIGDSTLYVLNHIQGAVSYTHLRAHETRRNGGSPRRG